MSDRLRWGPIPKRLSEVSPNEISAMPGIVGWRVLERSAGLSLGMLDQTKADELLLAAKPQTLVASQFVEGRAFLGIARRYQEATGRNVIWAAATASFDGGSYFYLEPLSGEEVRDITAQSTEKQTQRDVIITNEELLRLI